MHYAANGQRVDVMYFDNRIRDLIAPNNLFAGSVININQAQITGQELRYAGDFGSKHLQANLTLQNPRDANTGRVLQRRAEGSAILPPRMISPIGIWVRKCITAVRVRTLTNSFRCGYLAQLHFVQSDLALQHRQASECLGPRGRSVQSQLHRSVQLQHLRSYAVCRLELPAINTHLDGRLVPTETRSPL